MLKVVYMALHPSHSRGGASPTVWDHGFTCHPTQVNAPRLSPSQTDRYSIYLPRRDGKLSYLDWLYIEMV